MKDSTEKMVAALYQAMTGETDRFTIDGKSWVVETPVHRAAPDFYDASTRGAQVNLPDFMDWIAARLIRFGDSPNVDFVLTLRERANLLRAAIAKAEGRQAQ